MHEQYTLTVNGEESRGTVEDFLHAMKAPVEDALKDSVLKDLNALGRVNYNFHGNKYEISHTFH